MTTKGYGCRGRAQPSPLQETIYEVRHRLGAARQIMAEVDELRERRTRIREQLERITPAYGAAGHSQATDDKMLDAMGRMDALDREIAERLAKWTDELHAIDEMIDAVGSERHARLLRLRYMDGWTFGRIARKMHYERQSVYNMHDEAIRMLADKMSK